MFSSTLPNAALYNGNSEFFVGKALSFWSARHLLTYEEQTIDSMLGNGQGYIAYTIRR